MSSSPHGLYFKKKLICGLFPGARVDLGCYGENTPARVLPNRVLENRESVMTIDLCIGECTKRNYKYAGLHVSVFTV